MTAPTCRDLPELIESDPATAWSWDREGERTAFPPHERKPACERHDEKRPEKTFANLKTPEAFE